MAALLRGIGLDPKSAEKVAFMPLADLGPVDGSLFSSLNAKRRGSSDKPVHNGRAATRAL